MVLENELKTTVDKHCHFLEQARKSLDYSYLGVIVVLEK